MKKCISTLAVLALMTTNAVAHSKAEQTTPANDTIVQAVEAIEIRFDDPMRVTAIALNGPEGDVAIERETGLDPVTEFRAMPLNPIPAGLYQVDWRGLSSDGHPMQGSFSFTVSE